MAKYILLKTASVQCGEQNVQSAVAEIILQQPAQHRLEKCTSCDDSNVEYITSIAAQLEMIHAVTQEHYPNVIYTEMVVDKKEVKFQVHSGTSVNVIPVKFAADKKLMLLPFINYSHLLNDFLLVLGNLCLP